MSESYEDRPDDIFAHPDLVNLEDTSPARVALRSAYADLTESNRLLIETFDPRPFNTMDDLAIWPNDGLYNEALKQEPQYARELIDQMWQRLGVGYRPLADHPMPGEIDCVDPVKGGTQIRYFFRRNGGIVPIRIVVQKEGGKTTGQSVYLMTFDTAASWRRWLMNPVAAVSVDPEPPEPEEQEEPEETAADEDEAAAEVVTDIEPDEESDLHEARWKFVDHHMPLALDKLEIHPDEASRREAAEEYSTALGIAALELVSDPAAVDSFMQKEHATRLQALGDRVKTRRFEVWMSAFLFSGIAALSGMATGYGIQELAEQTKHVSWKLSLPKFGAVMHSVIAGAIGPIRHRQSRKFQSFDELRLSEDTSLEDRLKYEADLAAQYDSKLALFGRWRR